MASMNFNQNYPGQHNDDSPSIQTIFSPNTLIQRKKGIISRCCAVSCIIVFILLGGGTTGILYALGIFSDYYCPATIIDNGQFGGSIEYPGNNSAYPSNTRCEWKLKTNSDRPRIAILVTNLSVDCYSGSSIKIISSDGTVYGGYCSPANKLGYPMSFIFEEQSVTVRFQSASNYAQGKGFRLSYFYDNKVTNASTPKQCGISPVTNRIVDGDPAKPGQWPWQVSITIVSNEGVELCGGSVINDRWILTAAHCLSSSKGSSAFQVMQLAVRVGAYDLWKRIPQERWIPAAYHVKNSNYDDHTKDNDVALIQLSESIGLTPVCLPSSRETPPQPGTNCTTIGWGLTKDPDIDPAAALRQVYLPIVDSLTCDTYFSGISLTDNMICAGYDTLIKGTCQGDSGGPLMIQRGSQYYTVGITSWGRTACDEPGVYTKVANYIDWIQSHMKN